ncbi:hypothetical protein AB0D57_28440 [Streptomyces sp. NPDC048275]|uniref:hypothetical protein n=1 Tax=Streptomyces sp. NPDC048275 TaxID=3155629 RepID=UPI0033DAE044
MTVRFTPGGVLQIPLPGDRCAYAVMMQTRPYVAFYSDGALGVNGDAGDPSEDPLFVIAVHKKSYSSGAWGEILRKVELAALPEIPRFFRQNAVNPQDCELVDSVGGARSIDPQECVGLERDAVWEQGHIEQRIIDFYEGRKNAFVESMKVKI